MQLVALELASRDAAPLAAHEACLCHVLERFGGTRAVAAFVARTLLLAEDDENDDADADADASANADASADADAVDVRDDAQLLACVQRAAAAPALLPRAFVQRWSRRVMLFDVEQSNVFGEPALYVQLVARRLASASTPWPTHLPPRAALLALLDAQARAAVRWLTRTERRAALSSRASWLLFARAPLFGGLWRVLFVHDALLRDAGAAPHVAALRAWLRATTTQFVHPVLVAAPALPLTLTTI